MIEAISQPDTPYSRKGPERTIRAGSRQGPRPPALRSIRTAHQSGAFREANPRSRRPASRAPQAGRHQSDPPRGSRHAPPPPGYAMPPPPPPARHGTKRAGSGRGAGAGTPRAPCWRGRRGPGGGDEQRNSRKPRPQPAAPRPHRTRPAGGAEGRRPRTMRPGPRGLCSPGSRRREAHSLSPHSPAPGPTRVSPVGHRGCPRGRRGSLVLPAGPARARRRLPTPAPRRGRRPPPGRHGARALRPPNCNGRAAPAPGAGRTAQARVGGGALRRGRSLTLLTWRVGRASVAARYWGAAGWRRPGLS